MIVNYCNTMQIKSLCLFENFTVAKQMIEKRKRAFGPCFKRSNYSQTS